MYQSGQITLTGGLRAAPEHRAHCPRAMQPRNLAPVTSCFTTDNFVKVRVRVRVMVAGAKSVRKNVVGRDVPGQDDGNPIT